MSSNHTVTVAKASPTGDDAAPDVEISISAHLAEPNGDDWERQYDALYSNDARRIVDALKAALPGGTLQRVTALLVTDFGRYLRVKGWAGAETTAEIEMDRAVLRREDAERRERAAQENIRALEATIETHAKALGAAPVFDDMKAAIERLTSKEAF